MDEQITFKVMTENGIHELSVTNRTDVAHDFLRTIGTENETDRQIVVNIVQQASLEFKRKLDNFVDFHAPIAPHLNKLRKQINDLADDTYFLLIPNEFESSYQKLMFEEYLTWLNGSRSTTANLGELATEFEDLLTTYEIICPPTTKRTVIGERKSDRKTCRFCGRTKENGARFKKTAHAISEGLGNKNLIVSDECDCCNDYFGDSIEQALIELFNINRAYVGAEGKNGHPEIKYPHGSVTYNGSTMVIQGRQIDSSSSGTFTVSLGETNPFALADCYKALCKFAISVLPKEELEHVQETINWLKSTNGSKISLPKIATCIFPFPNRSPSIAVYIRRDDKRLDLPHIVSEFTLGPFVYVYKLPFSSKENDLNLDFFETTAFREIYRHYQAANWKSKDFSDTTERRANIKLKFKNRDNNSTDL